VENRRQFGGSARFRSKGGSAANGLLLKYNGVFALGLLFTFAETRLTRCLRLVFLSVN
jgi:hypothetical protein